MASGALVQRGLITRRTVMNGGAGGGIGGIPTQGRPVIHRGQAGTDLGGAIGGTIGGETGRTLGGAIGGFIEDLLNRSGSGNKPGQGAATGTTNLTGTGGGTCPTGTISIAGTCVDLVPGGATSGQGLIVPGLNGSQLLPGAVAPGAVQTMRLRCPEGMVLGRDNMCYWKQVLPKKFRKWQPAPKPPVSAADAKAIRRADAAKNRVKRLATKSGFTCKRK